ncbi:hypothetical protein HanXRQr2_Chr17g0785781 [Helianthus annuus]|uniref:Uncharacterized protein n=1 Tax=Helianthus annuus TaxID=4232 RepID=A0A9K3DED5_HELAN|nr:hypothetical protein HanXRQr2_Chr17g0785781 [Helianthus annuus]
MENIPNCLCSDNLIAYGLQPVDSLCTWRPIDPASSKVVIDFHFGTMRRDHIPPSCCISKENDVMMEVVS